MKTQKEIDKIINENDYFYPDEEEDNPKAGPCWGVKVNKESGKILFSIDNKDVFSFPLSKIKTTLNRDRLDVLLKILKYGNLKTLKKELER